MSQKRLTVLIAMVGFSCSFFPLKASAADGGSYSTSQDRGGTVEFSAGSESYDFRAEVGKPGAGKSVSQNFILESLASAEVRAADPAPTGAAGSGSINPAMPLPDQTQAGEAEKNSENGAVPGGDTPKEAALYPVLTKELAEQYVPMEEMKVKAQTLIEELVSGTAVRLSEGSEGKLPAVAVGALSLPFAFVFLNSLMNVISAIKSWNDAWLLILKLWYLPASLTSLRRKRKYWGTVYDSSTKQPLDPVIVELVNANDGQIVDQAITDMAGRYGFMAKPGRYSIRASKSHYQFPSKNITADKDSIFDHLYHGEMVEIKSETAFVAPNIPMDPLAFDWNQQEKGRLVKFHPLRERLEIAIARVLLWSGFIALVLVAIAQPTKLHYIYLAAYAMAIALHYFMPHQRLWGRVYKNGTNILMSGVLLELTPKNLQVVVAKAKSSQDGKYFLKCMPGEYTLSILSPDGSSKILKTVPVTVGESGMFAQDLPV